MDQETASYIFHHYSHLRSLKESVAYKHLLTTRKLGPETHSNRDKAARYHQRGWLTDDVLVLRLLEDGPERFISATAARILAENPGKVFLNKCPRCGRLARTPLARQCRHCRHTWFDTGS